MSDDESGSDSDMEDESDSEDDIPSQEECEELCQKFADVTGTDKALAMLHLQDREWDVQRAMSAYVADTGAQSDVRNKADPEPHRIRLLSWNIDGLDPGNHKSRTTAVCDTINKEKPHIVFLQEVIPETVAMMENKCSIYSFIPGGERRYFTAIMLRVGLTEMEDSSIHTFDTSTMLRNLLSVKCVVKGVKIELMTSHLESCRDRSEERKRQLTVAFEKMKEADGDRTVIFGGDLNLRDKELLEVGGVPDRMVDLWEATGRRPEAKFTWDTQKNDNLDMGLDFKPRCRFDRLYMRHAKPISRIKPVYFELIGLERLLRSQRFPSDHWGLLTHFDIHGVIPPHV